MPENITLPDIVKRPQILDFYNIAEIGKTPDYQFMGTGFTQADQTFGGQTTSKQYINEYAQSQILSSYQPSIDFTADMIANDKVMNDMFEIANKMKTGGQAIREYIRVWGFKPIGEDGEEFEATRMLMTVQAESLNGNEGEVEFSGSLQYFSGHQNGSFNTITKAFTVSDNSQSESF